MTSRESQSRLEDLPDNLKSQAVQDAWSKYNELIDGGFTNSRYAAFLTEYARKLETDEFMALKRIIDQDLEIRKLWIYQDFKS